LSEGSGLSVLLVEDTPGERWLFSEILRSRGHAVTACETGDGAFAVWSEGRHDLVLLDLMLPGIDGLEVCRTIRKAPGGERPVILVVTAKDEPDVLESVLDAGADDYVAKPVDVAVLNIRLAVAEQAVRDHVERLRAREALEESNQHLALLFASLPDVFFSIDLREDRLIQISPPVRRLFGVTRDEMGEGSRWKQLLYPGDVEGVEEAVAGTPPGRSVVHLTKRTAADGRERTLQFTLIPQREGAELVRVDGVVSDVTESVSTQRKLADRNRNLQSLFEFSEMAMEGETLETADRILERLEDFTGFPVISIEEYEPDRDLMIAVATRGFPEAEDDRPIEIPLDRTLTRKAIAERRSVVVVDPNSREHDPPHLAGMNLRTFVSVPLYVGPGVIGALVLAHPEPRELDESDLRWLESLANILAAYTDRVRSAADLREREANYRHLAEQLQRANRELEGFAYSVSHDLRAPLRTMTGFAHALVETQDEVLSEEAMDYARRIITSGKRAEELISDLLSYSRLSFEALELQPVNLQEVVDLVREQLAADIEARGAQVTVDGKLPTVLAVKTILTQVLSNLVSNAIKFVPEDRTPEVTLRLEEREHRLRIWVEDNGIGIPEGQEERIFRVFERLTDEQSRPGTGIGLAIVRRGMERIGGSAGVEPVEHGSRFWIEIQERRKQVWRPFRRKPGHDEDTVPE